MKKTKVKNKKNYNFLNLNVISAILLVILTLISIVIDCFWLYYKFWGKENLPQTIDSIYINPYEDENGESISVFNLNYHENTSNEDDSLVEFSINGFTDVEMQASAIIGLQTHGSTCYTEQLNEKNCTPEFANQYVSPYYSYYEIRDDESYPATTRLTRDYPLLVKVNDELYELKLNKTYRAGGIDYIFWKDDYNGYYTWSDLMVKLVGIINTAEYGTTYQRINLSEFFTVYKFNQNTKQFNNLDDSNYFFTECVFKITKNKSQKTIVRNSLFKMIDYDKSYGESSTTSDFWQATPVEVLTLDDFEKRYSEVNYGYYLTLNDEIKDQLLNQELWIRVDLEIDSSILGFDYNALESIKISSIKISTNESIVFEIKTDALKNTYMSIDRINASESITLKGE